MTTNLNTPDNECPAENLLKLLSGKWKAHIFKFALEGPVRFNSLLKQLRGSNKQSVATALKELEEAGILEKKIVKLKPLHIEYLLTPKGQTYSEIFKQAEKLLETTNNQ